MLLVVLLDVHTSTALEHRCLRMEAATPVDGRPSFTGVGCHHATA